MLGFQRKVEKMNFSSRKAIFYSFGLLASAIVSIGLTEVYQNTVSNLDAADIEIEAVYVFSGNLKLHEEGAVIGFLSFLVENNSDSSVRIKDLGGTCSNGVFSSDFDVIEVLEIVGFRDLTEIAPSIDDLFEIPIMRRDKNVVFPRNTVTWFGTPYRLRPLWDEKEFNSKSHLANEMFGLLPENMEEEYKLRNIQAYLAGVRLLSQYIDVELVPSLTCDWEFLFDEGRVDYTQTVPISFEQSGMDRRAFEAIALEDFEAYKTLRLLD